MTPEEIEKLPYRPCVGVVLMNRDGLVFAGQRIDNPGAAWQMPQGGIEADEKPRQAAFRELSEETGVSRKAVELVTKTKGWLKYDLPHDLVPTLWKGQYRGQKQRWFLMRYTGEDSLVNIATDVPEFSTWAWKPHTEVVDLIVPFKRKLYRAVFRQFAEHLPASK